MGDLSLLILGSSWAGSYLYWSSARAWTIEDDRFHGIDEDGVLANYGIEPFRRRNALLHSGDWRYDPLAAEIVSRRVSGAAVEAGWDVSVDSGRGFQASRDGQEMVVDASRPGVLRLRASAGVREVERVDEAERWVLERVFGSRGVSRVDEIMTVGDGWGG